MNLHALMCSPWLITESKLNDIHSLYTSHLRGEGVDISAVEQRLGKELLNESQGYTINSGVAIIPIQGVIGKKMNMFTEISGGASTQLIERDIKNALNDPNVKSIMLNIDSPGGTVDGTESLAEVVRVAKTQKPVLTFADGLMASAAYWIGSAANEIVAASDTTQVGSIGVITKHIDVSEAEKIDGIKTTVIAAGKNKATGNQHNPLSDGDKEIIQAQLNDINKIFTESVAKNRNTTAENVKETFGQGLVFLAKEAQSKQMIDHIADFDTTIENMSAGVWPANGVKVASDQVIIEKTQTKQRTKNMDIETLRAENPEIVKALLAEGAAAEVARIKSCDDALLAGYEDLVNSMKFDGKSTGGDVALAIIAQEKKSRIDHLANFRANAPKIVELSALSASELTGSEPEKTGEEKIKADWEKDKENLFAQFASFDNYAAYCKAIATGKVSVI